MYDNNPNDYDSPVTRPLILLGDSITESWSETGMGIHKNRAEGVASVMETELSSSSGLDPIVLGVSGDQTQHLLYRLQNGHMRAAQLSSSLSSSSSSNESGAGGDLFYDPSAIFVVMIGTNNLGSGELPGPTTKGILAVVEYILKETAESDCHVMLFRVLPRGDGKKSVAKTLSSSVQRRRRQKTVLLVSTTDPKRQRGARKRGRKARQSVFLSFRCRCRCRCRCRLRLGILLRTTDSFGRLRL